MSLQIETAQNVGVDYEVASVGERILAQFIDSAVRIVWIIAVMGFGSVIFKVDFSETWLIVGFIMLPALLYTLLCEYFLNGQTLGKMALKIKVIKTDGSKATLSSYLLRWLLSLIDVSVFSGIIAVITIAVNGKGQRLGDIAAGTTVIKTQPTIKLEHIIEANITPDYQPKYPGAANLSDKDIRTIHKVLATNNETLMDETMSKIEDLLGIHSLEASSDFLRNVANDHIFYANMEG